ncbi:MAG: TonB-dependent receptor [Caulobacterales bacterium]|nr:TonB-dependent receptor [Caulobacterales bacterium]
MSNRRHTGSWRIAATAAAAGALLAAPATGQSGDGGETVSSGVEVITVTAQRRAESVQDVGAAVTAFGGTQLERMAISDSNEILRMVPNLEIQGNNTSSVANIFLRGLGTSGPGFNNLSAVGIYADEVSLNSAVVNILQTFDLERVEVLRGPQNTLYGRNTTGGAVNFISRKPEIGAGFSGEASLTGGRFANVELESAVNLPLSDVAAARLAFRTRHRDGYNENPFLGTDDSEIEQYALRGQILIEPSGPLSVLLRAHGEYVDNTNNRWKSIGVVDPDGVAPQQSSTLVVFSCPNPIELGGDCVDANGFRDTESNKQNFADFPDPINRIEAFGASAQATYDFPGFTLTSITAFEANEYLNAEDSDASPEPVFHFYQSSEADQFTQEVRLTSESEQDLRWIGGAYYFWEDTAGSTGPAFYAMNMINQTLLELETSIVSVYGEAEYDFTDRLTGIVGLRYSAEEKEGRNRTEARLLSELTPFLPDLTDGQVNIDYFDVVAAVDAFTAAGGAAMGMSIDEPLDESFNEWGGRFGVEYRASEDVLLYGHASRGFKGGNFSAAPLQAIAGRAADAVQPEFVWTYEGGARTTWLDGSLVANLAVFYSDYTDQQVLRVTNNPDFGLAAILANVGSSTITGLELDALYVPAPGWSFNLNLGLLDTEIDEFTDDEGNDFSGNELINSPGVTALIGASREWTVWNGSNLGVAGNVRFVGEKQFDVSNDPLLSADSYALLNLQAFLEFGEAQQHRLLVSGSNVTDEIYFVNKSDFSSNGFLQALVGEPATWNVTFSTEF